MANDIKLSNSRYVSRLLQRTINQLINDEIDINKAKAIGYLGSVLLKAQEQEDLSKRIEKLEDLTSKRGAA